ncbi:MAG: rhamnosyltransferase WsaF family glycosyltransferase [Thermoleophilia bacterium]
MMPDNQIKLAGRVFDYYRANGAKKMLRRAAQRIAQGQAGDEPAPIGCSLPPEAAALPIRRVENTASRRRLTLVIPSVERQHLFAGSWTALKVFWEAARAHDFRARIVCNNTPYNPEALQSLDFISPAELAGIESWARPGGGYCEVEDDEIFIATAWWTAYALRRLELTHEVFYLVQDFEPSFYPWSHQYLLALETYKLNYSKIINTSILYDFFRDRGHLHGSEAVFFEPAINTELYRPGESRDYAATGKATLLIYGRPSVPRNLFDVACMSLQHFFRVNPTYREKIGRIISVGEKHADFSVDGYEVVSRGKMSLEEWAALARSSDVGISLMSSPHPSYIPLEMAASGMVVVSNNMFNKDLSRVNGNFVTSAPGVEEIADCIRRALDKLEDQDEIDANARLFVSDGRGDWSSNLKHVTEFIAGNKILEEETSKDGCHVADG